MVAQIIQIMSIYLLVVNAAKKNVTAGMTVTYRFYCPFKFSEAFVLYFSMLTCPTNVFDDHENFSTVDFVFTNL